MKTIWKFPLIIADTQTIKMPMGAEILCCQVQDRILCLWATVTPGEPLENRNIVIVGTGHPIPENIVSYLGSAQMMMGALVWHVFEVVE